LVRTLDLNYEVQGSSPIGDARAHVAGLPPRRPCLRGGDATLAICPRSRAAMVVVDFLKK